ncbi:MAG: hypothetical protein KGH66_03215 [Candidatus Micrarchaeota archaeon]|nr:hypothetical protein [Candidatus Micrarchaeota archaeon]
MAANRNKHKNKLLIGIAGIIILIIAVAALLLGAQTQQSAAAPPMHPMQTVNSTLSQLSNLTQYLNVTDIPNYDYGSVLDNQTVPSSP